MNVGERRDFDVLKEDLNTVRQDVSEIKTALLGDEYREDGIIPEVRKMREELDELNDFKKKVVWLVAFVGVITGFIFQFIKSFVK